MNSGQISQTLAGIPQIIFAVLIGSQANEMARPDSDWDVAVWITRDLTGMGRLSLLEEVRCQIACALDVSPEKIDVVDLANAGLAMRAAAVNEGVLLKQDKGSIYNRFLNRTWREIEEFNWEMRRAA